MRVINGVNLDEIKVDKDFISGVVKNRKYNEIIQDYYSRLFYELNELELIDKKLRSLSSCNKYWLLNRYECFKIKDFIKTNLCKDKFCSNCKKVKQASRMSKFIPLLEPYKDYLYHLTLTLPNCSSDDLKDTINLIFKSFTKLIDYIKCRKLIRGLDFSSWGYEGAIRSLEITFKNDSYHPHLHVCLVLRDFSLIGSNVNTYSYTTRNGSKEFRKSFSDQEILIQKIWYLLINGQVVNKKNIDSLELGYTCNIDKFQENQYAELFKYMTKEMSEDGQILTYENFKTLYFALHKVRQIQGYGCFYNVKDDDTLSDLVDSHYDAIIKYLTKFEVPLTSNELITDVLNDNVYTIISRKMIYKYLRQG